MPATSLAARARALITSASHAAPSASPDYCSDEHSFCSRHGCCFQFCRAFTIGIEHVAREDSRYIHRFFELLLHDAVSGLNHFHPATWYAQVLHMRLHTQKATNLVRNFRDELRLLMRRRSTAGLKRQLANLDGYLGALKACEQHRSGRCNKLTKKALSGLGHDAGAAAHAAEQLIQKSRIAKRRTFPILDLLRTGIGPAPDQLDALDAPNGPDYVPPPGPVPGTASGCNCSPHSHCAGRGREFPWCKINRTEPCSLLSQPSFVDAAGADHRVAGSGQPPAVWDYCGPPKENSETVHAGAHCERRDDIVEKYHDDSEFWDRDGNFNWNKVPRKDRMTLEAMIVPKEGQGLCVRTPSSGAHFVCPTAQDDLDEARPEGTEWARTRTWDFCVRFPDPFLHAGFRC